MARGSTRDELIEMLGSLGSRDAAGGRLVAVTGPPGIGKSHLVGTLTAHAARLGHRSAVVRAYEAERHLAFAGLTTLLHQVVALRSDAISDSTARADTDGERPSIDADPRHLLDAVIDGSGDIGHELAIGSGVLALLGDVVADAPTLLVLEDVQWLDAPSRQALLFALRRLRDDPVLGVLTSSDPTVIPTDIDTVELDGISIADAMAILAERAPVVDDVARACWDATGGNPLALRELARRLDARHLAGVHPIPWQIVMPPHLVDGYTARLDSLDANVRTALLVLAIASGSSIDAGLRAFGLDRRHLAAAVDAGLVTVGARPTFTQSTCAAAVIAAASPGRVRDVHRTMAEVVDDADEAAWHLSAAADGRDDEAAEALSSAARRARARGLPTAAAAAFERASELTSDEVTRRQLLHEAGAAWWYAARPERTIHALEPLLIEQTPVRDRALAALRVGSARSWLGSPMAAGRKLLDEALAAEHSDSDVAPRLLYASVASASLAADFRTASQAADRALALVDPEHDPVGAVIASAIRGFVTLVRGTSGAGDDDVSRLFGLAGLPLERLTDEQLDVMQFVAFGLHVAGRLDEALSVTDELRRSARARGLVSVMVYAAGLLGEIERRRGDWTMAQRWASDVSTTLSIEPFSQGEFGDAVCARIWAHQGRHDTAELVGLAEPMLDHARRHDLGFVSSVVQAALLSARVAAGDHEGAWHHLDQIERDVRAAGGLDPGVLWIDLDALDVLLATGRHGDAIRLVRDRRRSTTSPSGAWSAAVADLGRSLLVRHGHLAGERTQGTASPLDTIAAFDALGAPFEAARARLLLAEADLVPVDDRATVLQSAIDTFVRLGATPWERRAAQLGSTERTALQQSSPTGAANARSVIAADGLVDVADEAGVRSDVAAAVAQLSSAELRVGLTVASGCSNAEAAAELYLSQRTVEAHLRAIYRKLGVRNRTEMARCLNLAGTASTVSTASTLLPGR